MSQTLSTTEYFQPEKDAKTLSWNAVALKEKLKSIIDRDSHLPKYRDLPEEIDFSEFVPFLTKLRSLYRTNNVENAMAIGIDEQKSDFTELGETAVGESGRVTNKEFFDQHQGQIAMLLHNHPEEFGFVYGGERNPKLDPRVNDFLSFLDFMLLRNATNQNIPPPAIGMIHGKYAVIAVRTAETPLYTGKISPEDFNKNAVSILYRLFIFSSTITLGFLGDVANNYVPLKPDQRYEDFFIIKAAQYINKMYCRKFKIGLYVIPNYGKDGIGKKI